jgi:hypothetical protein
MTDWSLSKILLAQHDDIERKLSIIRTTIGHPGSKGAASERVWLELLQNYLPRRYQAESAHVVDSYGKFSDQIDVVIFDRQYSPFIFKYEGQTIIPSESVYAVFEAKQSINSHNLEYAKKKVASVRSLHRTSLPIPHAGGIYAPKALTPILGGVLSLESDWQPSLGQSLKDALVYNIEEEKLDFGCVAAHGNFYFNSENKTFDFSPGGKPATEFLFRLISMLQVNGTVPMIDIQAYAQWLND